MPRTTRAIPAKAPRFAMHVRAALVIVAETEGIVLESYAGDKYRITLRDTGEMTIYNEEGSSVLFKLDGVIDLSVSRNYLEVISSDGALIKLNIINLKSLTMFIRVYEATQNKEPRSTYIKFLGEHNPDVLELNQYNRTTSELHNTLLDSIPSYRWDIENVEWITGINGVSYTKMLGPLHSNRTPRLRLQGITYRCENNSKIYLATSVDRSIPFHL